MAIIFLIVNSSLRMRYEKIEVIIGFIDMIADNVPIESDDFINIPNRTAATMYVAMQQVPKIIPEKL